MTKSSAWKMACGVLLFCAATGIASPAQTFNTLVSFDGADGEEPLYVSLAQGPDGNFYGTTQYGGTGNVGTVFRISPAGTMDTIYDFCSQPNCADGGIPQAGLLLATDGNFYGTTENYGGTERIGTVFRITPAGALTTLYSFCTNSHCPDGAFPTSQLIEATDGDLYGTTVGGGTNGVGTIFKITLKGTLTTLHNFNNTDGAGPIAGLVEGTDGNFYGTTVNGGVKDIGTVFKMSAKGNLTTLYQFGAEEGDEGDGPYGTLVQGSNNSFYGTTAVGAGGDAGNVFEITRSGTLTSLVSFDGADGTNPIAGLIIGRDGNFYGTASQGGLNDCVNGCGTLYEMTPTGELTTLHTFDSTDGAYPYGGLLQSTNGNFYGVTSGGGTYSGCLGGGGCGTVFSLSTGLAPFVTFVRRAGKVGQTGGILGQGFTGTTSVSLNGTPASFTVVSDTFIKATVPPGATSGYVTVVTLTGTLTSNVPFRVLQ